MLKKISYFLLICLVLLMSVAVLVPVLYKKEVLAKIVDLANKELNGTLAIEDVDISLFKNFPEWTIQLNDTKLTSFSMDTSQLLQAKKLAVSVDFFSLFKKSEQISLNSVAIENATMVVLMDSLGNGNYNISKTTSTSSSPVQFDLKKFEIVQSNIILQNISDGTLVQCIGMNHKSSMNMAKQIFDVKSETTIDSLSYGSAMVSYLKHARLQANVDLNVDQNTKSYSLHRTDIRLNDLLVNLSGNIKEVEAESYDMQLEFKAPGNAFKELFSLIPSAYTKDYKDVKVDGSFSLDGKVNGVYNKTSIPAFKIKMQIKDGRVQYPSLPYPISDIQSDITLDNPGNDIKKLLISIKPLRFNIQHHPFFAELQISQTSSNPYYQGSVKTKLQLEDVRKALPLEKGVDLSGLVDADVSWNFKQSDINSAAYSNVNFNGYVNCSDVKYVTADMPAIHVQQLQSTINPQFIQIPVMQMRLGKSDMSGTAQIKHPLNYIGETEKMLASIQFNSDVFDANEWMSDEVPTASGAVAEKSAVPSMMQRIDLQFSGKVKDLKYDTYNILNSDMTGSLANDKLTIQSYTANVNGSNINASGNLNQILTYVFEDKTLTGNLKISAGKFDMDKFMAAPAGSQVVTTDTGVFVVPEHMDLTIDATATEVLYSNMQLKQVVASIQVVEDEIQFRKLQSNALGGTMSLQGIYNSSDVTKPKFDLKYDLTKVKFQDAFKSVPLFQKIAPIASVMDGVFNTSLTLNGDLGKDMMPNLSSLNADGLIETVDAFIKNFKLLNAIGEKLNVEVLKNYRIQNSKNWFNIEQGRVLVKDFKQQYQDIGIAVDGMHQLTGGMNYVIKLKIPQSKFKVSGIGNPVESGLGFVKQLANKAGMDIKTGEFVNVAVTVSGSLKDPSFKYTILGTDGKSIEKTGSDIAKDIAAQAEDSLRKVASKKVDELKDKALEKAQQVEDSLKKIAQQKIDEETSKAKEKIKQEAGKVIDSTLLNQAEKKIEEEAGKVLGPDAKKGIENAKDKLKKWDPFKKK